MGTNFTRKNASLIVNHSQQAACREEKEILKVDTHGFSQIINNMLIQYLPKKPHEKTHNLVNKIYTANDEKKKKKQEANAERTTEHEDND